MTSEEIEQWYAACAAKQEAHNRLDKSTKSAKAEASANASAVGDDKAASNGDPNATTTDSNEQNLSDSSDDEERKTSSKASITRAGSPIGHTPPAEIIEKLTDQQGAMSNALMKVTASVAVGGVKMRNAVKDAIEVFKNSLAFDLAKVLGIWIRAHPWETATIIIPLILLACTPAILGAVGFGAGGVIAGSIAAGAQAGIGSVAAGSGFAILTSAAMGGYGVPIVFGGVWAGGTVLMGGIAALKRWFGSSRDGGGRDSSEVGPTNDKMEKVPKLG